VTLNTIKKVIIKLFKKRLDEKQFLLNTYIYNIMTTLEIYYCKSYFKKLLWCVCVLV